MGEQRQRTRTKSKVDELPEEWKTQVESMLIDASITYTDISNYLKSNGYDISKSAIGRYALRTNSATQRLLEAQEQTRMLLEAIKKNPDADYTEGALQIMSGEITKRFAQAQEEWDDMPLDKAARVMVALSRSVWYKRKLQFEFSRGVDAAAAKIKEAMRQEINADPELLARLSAIVDRQAEEARQ